MGSRLAGCIIKDADGKILLLHRNTAKRQQWEIPGGKIEPGEDSKAAAIREVQEELGVTVAIEKQLGEKEFTQDSITMHYTWYQAKIISGQPKIMEPDIFDDIQYFTVEKMDRTELSNGAQAFLVMISDKS